MKRSTASSDSSTTTLPTSLIIGGTTATAFKGIIALLAYAEGMSVSAVLAWRFALALPIFWLITLAFGHNQPRRVDFRAVTLSLLVGTLMFLAMAADFYAVSEIGAGPSRAILFTFPAFIWIIEVARGKAQLTWATAFALSAAWIGVAMVALPNGFSNFGSVGYSGVAASLGAALVHSVCFVARKDLAEQLGSLRYTTIAYSGAALGLMFALPLSGGSGPLTISTSALGWMITMALACTVFPFFAMTEGVRRMGPAKASILTMFGPAITVIAAWLLLDESMTWSQLLGVGLILATIGVQQHQKFAQSTPAGIAVKKRSGTYVSSCTGFRDLRRNR